MTYDVPPIIMPFTNLHPLPGPHRVFTEQTCNATANYSSTVDFHFSCRCSLESNGDLFSLPPPLLQRDRSIINTRHVVLCTSTFNYTNSVLSHCNLLWGDNRKEIFTGQDRKTRKKDMHTNAWAMYELDNCRGRTRDRLQEERAHLVLSNGKRECVKRCHWQKH